MDRPVRASRRQQLDAGTTVAVAVLILAPIVALLWVGSYAKATPKLWGFPFFYWYQFLWVFLAAGCTYAAYLLLHRRRTGDRADVDASDGDWDRGGGGDRDRDPGWDSGDGDHR